MGHLINPISSRLSVNTFWNSNWSLASSFNYINLFKKDYVLFGFLNWFLKKSKYGKFNIIISHYKIFRVYNNIYINFYYYNIGLEEKKYNFQVLYLINLLKKKRKNFWKKKGKNLLKSRKIAKNYKNNWFLTIPQKTYLKKKSFHRVNKNRFKFNKIKIKRMYQYIIKILFSNIFWYLLKYSMNFFLNKFYRNSENYIFNFFSLNFNSITTEIINTYISLRLKQNYSLNWVLRPVIKDLNNKLKTKIILGYKIVCSGRFTRKQIATYMWKKQGALNFNTFSSFINYSESSVKLKYGLCGLKVWLNFGKNNLILKKRSLFLTYPLYTPFKYIVDFKKKNLVFSLNYWFYVYIRICFSRKYKFLKHKFCTNIKIKILIKYLLNKLVKNLLLHKFKVNYFESNKLIIQLSKLKKISTCKNSMYFRNKEIEKNIDWKIDENINLERNKDTYE